MFSISLLVIYVVALYSLTYWILVRYLNHLAECIQLDACYLGVTTVQDLGEHLYSSADADEQ